MTSSEGSRVDEVSVALTLPRPAGCSGVPGTGLYRDAKALFGKKVGEFVDAAVVGLGGSADCYLPVVERRRATGAGMVWSATWALRTGSPASSSTMPVMLASGGRRKTRS